jgi:6-phosphogluconolactonase/glucosamine-6-phosphate isomerase/deaminase
MMATVIFNGLSLRNFRANLLWGNGSTIRAVTAEFMKLLKAMTEGPDLSALSVFAQDTWGKMCVDGLEDGDLRTFELWYERHFFDPLKNFGFNRVNALFPQDAYPSDFVAQPGYKLGLYDRRMAERGGIHIGIVVVGPHGHVAFAEQDYAPASEWLTMPSMCIGLTEASRLADKDYPGCNGDFSRVPKTALTITPGTLINQLAPKACLVVGARGDHNKENVFHMLEGEIGPSWPISFVQLMAELRPDVEVVVVTDEAARVLLTNQ